MTGMSIKKKWEHNTPIETFIFNGIQKNATASYEQVNYSKNIITVWLDDNKQAKPMEVTINATAK